MTPKLFFFDCGDYGSQAQVVAYTEDEARGYLLAEKKPYDEAYMDFLFKESRRLLDEALKKLQRLNRKPGFYNSPEHHALFKKPNDLSAQHTALCEIDYHNKKIDEVLAGTVTVFEIGQVSWTEVS